MAKKVAATGPVEGPWVLPDGWHWKRIDAVAPVNPRRGPDKLADDAEVAFVPMAAVEAETGKIDVSTRRTVNSVRKGFTRFASGDVIFAKITPCMENGKVAVIPEVPHGIGFGSTEFHVLAPLEVSAPYLYYWISQRGFRETAEFNMTGTAGQKRVPTDFVRNSLIPVPPGPVQDAIVARIDELFAEIDDGEAALDRARDDLATWRKALLKAAVTGELTADWRAASTSSGTGGDLLNEILADRRARWDAEPKNRGKRYPEPAVPDHDALPDLPPNWCWATMDQLSWASGYGTSEKCFAEHTGTPVLRIPNVRRGIINLEDLKYTAAPLALDEGRELATGDLLIVRTNGSDELIGRAALVLTPPPETTYFASYLIRLRLLGSVGVLHWIALLVDSPVFRASVLRSIASSAGQYNLSLSKIETFAVPIPPLDEIDAVISRVQSAQTNAADGKRSLNDACAAAATLRQSVLAAAFRGELA